MEERKITTGASCFLIKDNRLKKDWDKTPIYEFLKKTVLMEKKALMISRELIGSMLTLNQKFLEKEGVELLLERWLATMRLLLKNLQQFITSIRNTKDSAL